MTTGRSGLRIAAQVRDLPPKWDGQAVEWRGWTHGNSTNVLHSPRERCEGCGSENEPSVNPGITDPRPGETYTYDPIKKTRTGREYIGQPKTVTAGRWVRIVAFRCPDCHRDEVWDKRTDEWWTLDESDYGAEGSVDPRLF